MRDCCGWSYRIQGHLNTQSARPNWLVTERDANIPGKNLLNLSANPRTALFLWDANSRCNANSEHLHWNVRANSNPFQNLGLFYKVTHSGSHRRRFFSGMWSSEWETSVGCSQSRSKQRIVGNQHTLQEGPTLTLQKETLTRIFRLSISFLCIGLIFAEAFCGTSSCLDLAEGCKINVCMVQIEAKG